MSTLGISQLFTFVLYMYAMLCRFRLMKDAQSNPFSDFTMGLHKICHAMSIHRCQNSQIMHYVQERVVVHHHCHE